MDAMMRAVMLEAPNTVRMREIPVPTPGMGEILIRTKAALICTSDIMDMKFGLFTGSLPMVMGHEAAGVVAAIADDVTGINVGDEVAVHPVLPCYKCASCTRGLSHLCDDMGHLCFNRPGVFAEYFITRPDCVRKKPSDMPFPVAALMEPVCVCLEAVHRGSIKEGDRILIAGDGPFGILISKLCALKKPKQIIHTGFYDYRLKQTAGLLAQTININDDPNPSRTIMELTDGEGVDCSILCVSSSDAVDLCIEMLRSRGTMVVFSAVAEKTPVDLLRIHLKELNIAGSNNDEDFMDDAMRLLGDSELDLKSIITHEIPFTDWKKAFHIADEQKDRCLKVSMIF